MNKGRVAVTGASGYVGSGLIARLDRDDAIERVLAMDVRPLPRQHSAKVVFQQHDVAEPMAGLLGDNQIEAVVHLAYLLNPSHNSKATQRVNVGGMASVLDACAQAGVQHILYLSSTTVYGAHPDNPPLLTEASPVRPIKGFRYGEGKAQAEAMLTDFTRRYPTFTATILRACPVMGPNADNFISRAFSKPFLVGVRGYDPPMQLIHEDDLAEILYLCLMTRPSGVYNVAGDGTVRWSEMASIFGRRLINLPAPIIYGLTDLTWALRLQGDSPACGLDLIRYGWTASTEKIKRDLGVSFRHSSREAWEAFVRRQAQPAPVNQTGGR